MNYIYDKLLNVVAKQQKTTLKQFSKNEKSSWQIKTPMILYRSCRDKATLTFEN